MTFVFKVYMLIVGLPVYIAGRFFVNCQSSILGALVLAMFF